MRDRRVRGKTERAAIRASTQLAPRFGSSLAIVCRSPTVPLLALEEGLSPDADRLWIADGTLIPGHDRTAWPPPVTIDSRRMGRSLMPHPPGGGVRRPAGPDNQGDAHVC